MWCYISKKKKEKEKTENDGATRQLTEHWTKFNRRKTMQKTQRKYDLTVLCINVKKVISDLCGATVDVLMIMDVRTIKKKKNNNKMFPCPSKHN